MSDDKVGIVIAGLLVFIILVLDTYPNTSLASPVDSTNYQYMIDESTWMTELGKLPTYNTEQTHNITSHQDTEEPISVYDSNTLVISNKDFVEFINDHKPISHITNAKTTITNISYITDPEFGFIVELYSMGPSSDIETLLKESKGNSIIVTSIYNDDYKVLKLNNCVDAKYNYGSNYLRYFIKLPEDWKVVTGDEIIFTLPTSISSYYPESMTCRLVDIQGDYNYPRLEKSL